MRASAKSRRGKSTKGYRLSIGALKMYVCWRGLQTHEACAIEKTIADVDGLMAQIPAKMELGRNIAKGRLIVSSMCPIVSECGMNRFDGGDTGPFSFVPFS